MIEDIIKKAFYTGVGFLANPKGFKEKIDDLVNKGDMTAEEGKKAFAEFEKDFKTKTEDLEGNIQGMIRNALDKMDIPSAEKVAAMEKRIKSLEVKVGKLSKELKEIKATAAPVAKKTTTRKKPAAKKAATPKAKKAE
ncbi:MAG: phasin family protein [Saprospiraceae bacterium]